MLKTWNITYQIGTKTARIGKCLTDDETPATDENFQKMLGIQNNVAPSAVRLVKVIEA